VESIFSVRYGGVGSLTQPNTKYEFFTSSGFIYGMIDHLEAIRKFLHLSIPGIFYYQTGDANLTDWQISQ
jgi:hypothetical protein